MATTEDSRRRRRSCVHRTPGRSDEPVAARPAISRDGLATLHERFCAGLPAVARPLLDGAYSRAQRLDAAGGYGEDGLRIAAPEYAAEAVVVLAAEGILEASDVQAAVDAAVAGIRVEAARLELYRRASSATQLLELPPLVAAGVQLRLSPTSASWRRSRSGGGRRAAPSTG